MIITSKFKVRSKSNETAVKDVRFDKRFIVIKCGQWLWSKTFFKLNRV